MQERHHNPLTGKGLTRKTNPQLKREQFVFLCNVLKPLGYGPWKIAKACHMNRNAPGRWFTGKSPIPAKIEGELAGEIRLQRRLGKITEEEVIGIFSEYMKI
jgi:hypothetical protein